MNISVIVALYNGERYLIHQLDTIYHQTQQSSEVLLFDDCSTDLTYKITELFISEHKLTNWHLKRNKNNLGWRRNFYELIKAAKGDIIFFSDQDDIWDIHKIELMTKTMKQNPNIEILACNYNMIFENPETKWRGLPAAYEPYGRGELEMVKMGKWWLGSLRYGSMLAVKKSIKDIFLETWQDGLPHDGLTTALGIARGSFYIMNRVLATHRMHDSNNTPQYKHTKVERLKNIKISYNMGNAVRNSNNLHASEENIKFMDKILFFLKKRIIAIENSNLIELIKLLKYISLYPRYRTWVADVISSFK